MVTDLARVAAVEELPPDARGSRRVLRLHAVGRDASGSIDTQASCGYRYRAGELRPDRPWATVTPSGRCALCDARHRADPGGSIDVRDVRDVRDIPDVTDIREARDVDGDRQRSGR